MDDTSLKIENLIEVINSDDSYARHEAVQMLGEIGSPQAIKVLLGLLKDKDIAIREGAINSLINIGGENVALGVVDYLRDSNSPSLRNTAVEILSQIGFCSIPVLLPLLKEDDDNDILIFAIDIIGRVFNKVDKKIIPEFVELLKHKNPNIRASAAKTLGFLNDDMATKPLLDLLHTEDEEWVRFSAVEAIGRIVPADAVSILLDIIRREDGIVAGAAIDAIGKVITTGSDANQAMAAMEGMIREGVKLPIDVVISILEKVEGEISDHNWRDTFIDFFISELKNGDRGTRHAALQGLGIIKAKRSVPAILRFTGGVPEDDEEMLSAIKGTLIQIGEVDELVNNLREGAKNLMVIIGAIEEIGQAGTVDVLRDLLAKVDSGARRAIISTLKSVAPQTSIETLVLSLKDSAFLAI